MNSLKLLFTTGLVISFLCGAVSVRAETCDPYASVYAPAGQNNRADGIHATMTVAKDQCESQPCAAAKIHLNSLDAKGALLSQVTMRYTCMGTGWVCKVTLKSEDEKHSVQLDPVGISKDFTPAPFLGDKGEMPHAWVFPGIGPKLHYFNWKHAAPPEKVFRDGLPLEIATHNDTPAVWVFSKCNN